MAKSPKASVALNLAALATIVAAGPNGTFAPLAEISALADAGLVEVNTEVTDASGNVAVRATEAGVAKANEGNDTPAPQSSGFAVMALPDDILSAMKEKKRAGRSGGSKKYPFDGLEVGQGFFVAATEKMPEPAKSLASTVSSATARYAEEVKDDNGETVMETVTVKDYQLDEDGKRVKGEDGKFIVTGEHEEQRAKMQNTRVFRLSPHEGGAYVGRIA